MSLVKRSTRACDSISIALFLTAGLLVVTTGCGSGASKGGAHLSAEQLLADMAAAYQSASSYADSGELQLQFTAADGQAVDERVDFAVSFARPNKLRMNFYQANAVCDGKKLYATVADLDKQVLERTAPERMTLEFLYADDALRQALTEQIAGSSPQLALLLSNDFVKTILADSKSVSVRAGEKIDDEPCECVEITRADGDLTFWIAAQSKALKRIEFPTMELKKQLDQQVGTPVSGVRLVADFRGARLNPKLEDVAFEFEVPQGAKLMARFDLRALVPPPPAPSKLLGQKIGQFNFVRLDGSPVTPEALKGKVAIIDFWATWCGPCLENMPSLNQVYEKYKNDERVEFLAVSVDQGDVKPEVLQSAMSKAGTSVPIVRDNNQSAFKVFQVEGIPNLFVLGPDGTIEDNEVGMNPALAEELPARVEKLLSGQSIHADAISRYEVRKARYDASLKEPLPPLPEESSDAKTQLVAEIAPKSDPQHFSLTQLWNNTEIKQPGNVLAVENSDGAAQIFVHDGWRKITRLDEQGKVAAEYDLATPQMAVVSYLRSAVDRDGGRWFMGSASTQRQLFLFDSTFKPALSYPNDSPEISDFQFVDLDADRVPEIAVSYWGNRGVEVLALDGAQRWKSGALENVFRMAQAVTATGEKPKLLASHSRGSIAQFDAQGQPAGEIAVDKRFVRAVYAADLTGDGVSELAVLAPVDEGRDVLLGIDAAGKELWSYELPPGIHEQPIEHLISAQLGGDSGNWIVCGADGSIHILAADGKLVDRFNHGAQLTGIAATRIATEPALVIASTAGVRAVSIKAR